MHKDIQTYKEKFLIFMVLFTFSVMHLKLTGSFEDVTLTILSDFKAPLPYAQRLLMPLLATPLRSLDWLPLGNIYFLLELVFVSLLYLSLKKTLVLFYDKKYATFLALLFFAVYPLVAVINYRYSVGQAATFSYPYDVSALFFTVLGLYLCLTRQWLWLYVVVVLATLNRESSILCVLLIPTLYALSQTAWKKPFIIALLCYCLTRFAIAYWLLSTPGNYLVWFYRHSEYTYFFTNMYWLFSMQNIFLLLAEMAFLPLAWFAFSDYIPQPLIRIRYLVLIYFLGLLCVGIFMEARIFGEIVVLMYVPVCVGVSNWLADEIQTKKPKTWMDYMVRYAIITALLIVVIINQSFNILLERLVG